MSLSIPLMDRPLCGGDLLPVDLLHRRHPHPIGRLIRPPLPIALSNPLKHSKRNPMPTTNRYSDGIMVLRMDYYWPTLSIAVIPRPSDSYRFTTIRTMNCTESKSRFIPCPIYQSDGNALLQMDRCHYTLSIAAIPVPSDSDSSIALKFKMRTYYRYQTQNPCIKRYVRATGMTFCGWRSLYRCIPSPPYQLHPSKTVPSLAMSKFTRNNDPNGRTHASNDISERWKSPFADGVYYMDVFHRRHAKSIHREPFHRSVGQDLHLRKTPLPKPTPTTNDETDGNPPSRMESR